VVADVASTGALLAAIRLASPAARVVGVDVSAAMLRVVLAMSSFTLPAPRSPSPKPHAGFAPVAGSAPSPGPGSADHELRKYGVKFAPMLQCLLAPPRRLDAKLDRPDALKALIGAADLRPGRASGASACATSGTDRSTGSSPAAVARNISGSAKSTARPALTCLPGSRVALTSWRRETSSWKARSSGLWPARTPALTVPLAGRHDTCPSHSPAHCRGHPRTGTALNETIVQTTPALLPQRSSP
jgi:hypothetical protein